MIIDTIKSSFYDLWPMLIIGIVIFISIRFASKKSQNFEITFYKDFLVIITFIFFMIFYKLLGTVNIHGPRGINLFPLREILKFKTGTSSFNIHVLYSIILFIPFGFIISNYIRSRKVWPSIIVTIITCITKELIYYYTGGSFDIDDILLNTLGSFAGFLIYIAYSSVESHLPSFLRTDKLKNLICIVILCIVIYYILRLIGVIA